jgi:adenylosuccinate synthase
MPATVIVGLQWGDEGKGKTTDLLAGSVSHVAASTPHGCASAPRRT